MLKLVRVIGVFLGALLLISGVGRMAWNIYSWGVLSKLGERPALYGSDPRVSFWPEAIQAASGAAVIALVIVG